MLQGLFGIAETALFLFGVGVILIVGVAGFWVAYDAFSENRTLARTPVREIGSVSSDGRVIVRGTVETLDGQTVHAPLRDRQGVIARWKITELWGDQTSPEWETRVETYEAVPFKLRDGTVPARIDVRGGRLGSDDVRLAFEESDQSPVVSVARSAEPPDRVRELEERIDAPDLYEENPLGPFTDDGAEQGDRRYFESVVEPGGEVAVMGTATVDDDGVTVTCDDGCLVTDRPLSDVRSRNWVTVVFGLLVGIGCFGLAVAAFTTGTIAL